MATATFPDVVEVVVVVEPLEEVLVLVVVVGVGVVVVLGELVAEAATAVVAAKAENVHFIVI